MRRDHRRYLVWKLAAAHVGLLLGVGCGLIDLASFRGVTFKLPSKSYSVSTTDPRWKAPPPGGVPNITCGTGGLVMDCCKPPAPVPAINCVQFPLTCDAGPPSVCALKFSYEVAQVIDLAKEVPDLKQVKGMVLSEILLKQIDVTITSTLNLATPPIDLYVAPAGVTTASNPNVRKIGTIPAKPPNFVGTEIVTIGADAQQAFSGYARDFQTPFNILISTTVLVKGGTATPSGKLDFVVSGTVEARF